MILLRKHRLLFIKGVKVAGTSIEVFLSRHASADDIVTPIFPHSPEHEPRNYLGTDGAPAFYNHMGAAAVRSLIGDKDFLGLRRFGVVRNPFEKVRSHFAMQYVRTGGNYDVDAAITDLGSEVERYCDARGECLLTDVIRYERLDEGLKRLFDEVGLPFDRLSIREKGEYRRQCPVEAAFDRAQVKRIAEKFSWEFEHYYAGLGEGCGGLVDSGVADA